MVLRCAGELCDRGCPQSRYRVAQPDWSMRATLDSAHLLASADDVRNGVFDALRDRVGWLVVH